MELADVRKIINTFPLRCGINRISPVGDGHIHDTYRVHTGGEKDYLLQGFNTRVFSNTFAIEQNMAILADVFSRNTQGKVSIPTALRNRKGRFLTATNSGCWRMYEYCEHAGFSAPLENTFIENAGRAFGEFILILNSENHPSLETTIQGFHDLPWRISNLKKAILQNHFPDRTTECNGLARRMLDHFSVLKPLTDAISNKEIPLRTVHNDTKINNLLFDHQGKVTHIVDLDTTMPGYVLYDYGDSIRTIATSLEEDAADLDAMNLDLARIGAFSHGFIPAAAPILTDAELDTLHLAPDFMAFIMAVRFLTDYLEGDTYYKTSYAGQNLVRARNQFHLACLFMEASETIRTFIAESTRG